MKKFFPFLFLFVLTACSKNFVATSYQFEEKKLVPNSARDETMAAYIQPYKDSLDKEMNVVLAVSDVALNKSQPESDLGNMMCDLLLKKSKNAKAKTLFAGVPPPEMFSKKV